MIAVPDVTGLVDVNENWAFQNYWKWSKFFKIGSSFAEVNADRTITPLTWFMQSIAICDVDRIGISSYDLE